jgi:hypothetical protein
MPSHPWALWSKLGFYLCDRRGNLLVHFGPHARGSEEQLVGPFAENGICKGDGAENAIAADKVERLAEVAKEEERKYHITKATK